MSNAFFQNSFYIGNTFNAILYGKRSISTTPHSLICITGVELMLYAKTMHTYATSDSRHERSSRFFMFFSTILLILITIFMAGQSILGEEMWIVNANYPGGSAAYLANYASVWYQTMGTTASIILQLMSDGLLVSTSQILNRDVMNTYYFVDLPVLGCLAGPENHHFPFFPMAGDFGWVYIILSAHKGSNWIILAFGILELYVSGTPNANFFVGLAAHIGLTYVATSIGLNVLVTSLICGRILYYARVAQRQLGPAIAETYFSIATIIIESALPYTLCGVAFLVSFGLNSEISILFLSFYVMFTASAVFSNCLTCVLTAFSVRVTPDAHSSGSIRKGME